MYIVLLQGSEKKTVLYKIAILIAFKVNFGDQVLREIDTLSRVRQNCCTSFWKGVYS